MLAGAARLRDAPSAARFFLPSVVCSWLLSCLAALYSHTLSPPVVSSGVKRRPPGSNIKPSSGLLSFQEPASFSGRVLDCGAGTKNIPKSPPSLLLLLPLFSPPSFQPGSPPPVCAQETIHRLLMQSCLELYPPLLSLKVLEQ